MRQLHGQISKSKKDPSLRAGQSVEQFIRCFSVMPVKTGIQQSLKVPGFRVALAIASLPGMTIEFFRASVP
jgi:hypothetical protein